MTETASLTRPASPKTEPVDILIVGAGLSGIGSAYHLTKQCPARSFVVLDALESFGGTWLIHKYPGIRSDSDLYTFGYRFKPWTGAPMATADAILKYLGEVIDENGLTKFIRYQHRVDSASWSSQDQRWTIEATRTDTNEPLRFIANFLWMCQGYYRHAEGYTPQWEGMERFRGAIVHPQTWPEHLDYQGKHVICIGSGATTATLVPAIAADCAHITILQRSPTYFISDQNNNRLANRLREIGIQEAWIHEIVRRNILYDQNRLIRRSFLEPEAVKQELLAGVRAYLGPDFDLDTHFTPTYRPWRQRLAFVPDGDLFQCIRAGKVSIVTDEIDRLTETGIRLKSGQHLDADMIITATGFTLSVLGDINFTVDGKLLVFAETVTYRGMMFTGVPNLVWTFGYFRASWTLRVELIADFVCRLLNHMKQIGVKQVSVALRPEDKDMPLLPWIDPENFNPGYLIRSLHLLPKRGNKPQWQHSQDYWAEKDELPAIDLHDSAFVYE